MMNPSKYERQYFMPPETSLDWTKKEYITKAPTWCSVDLRDGNQALITSKLIFLSMVQLQS